MRASRSSLRGLALPLSLLTGLLQHEALAAAADSRGLALMQVGRRATKQRIGQDVSDPPESINVCYFTNWARYRAGLINKGKDVFELGVPPGLCTHFMYGFATVTPDFDLESNDPNADHPSGHAAQDQLCPGACNDPSAAAGGAGCQWPCSPTRVMRGYEGLTVGVKAKDPGAKALISVGGWNFNDCSANAYGQGTATCEIFSTIASSEANIRLFAQKVIAFCRKWGFDGFDLDWEYPVVAGHNSNTKVDGEYQAQNADYDNYITMLRVMKEEFLAENPSRPLLLTAAVGVGKSTVETAYNIAEMSKHLDLINLMTYDLHGAWESRAACNANLYATAEDEAAGGGVGAGEAVAGYPLSVSWAVDYWIQHGARPEQLTMGLATYGRGWTLADATDGAYNAPASGASSPGVSTKQAGYLAYYEIMELISSGQAVRHYDAQRECPYIVTVDGEWIGYDDEQSLHAKLDFAKTRGLRGTMVWALDLDDFTGAYHGSGTAYPLISAIKQGLDPIASTSPGVVTTEVPVGVPTAVPSEAPTGSPTEMPTSAPTEAPTEAPTDAPTEAPVHNPSCGPLGDCSEWCDQGAYVAWCAEMGAAGSCPALFCTLSASTGGAPAVSPTPAPALAPTPQPSPMPSLPLAPTPSPTPAVIVLPTPAPTPAATVQPTPAPIPTSAPTEAPTEAPTDAPTETPANNPSCGPIGDCSEWCEQDAYAAWCAEMGAAGSCPALFCTLSASTGGAPVVSPTPAPNSGPTPQPITTPPLTLAPTPSPTPIVTVPPTPAPTPATAVPSTLAPTPAPTVQPPPAPTPTPVSGSASVATQAVVARLEDSDSTGVFMYDTGNGWIESDIYTWPDMVKAVQLMATTGVGSAKLWLGDNDDPLYGLVNVAAFLAQCMQETIQYNACDENNWSNGAVAQEAGGSAYSATAACGQLHQSYQDYQCSAEEDVEAGGQMACDVEPDMEMRATTQASWYGAPPKLFCAPRSKVPKAPRWETSGPWCAPEGQWGHVAPFPGDVSLDTYFDYVNEGGGCRDYSGIKAGGWTFLGEGCEGGACPGSPPIGETEGRTDVEGCCWWGRGVIQTTGVCNFGKLNFYMGKRAALEGRASIYPDIDFCRNPGAICEPGGPPELKWVAGFFYWLNAVQTYSSGGWSYKAELKKWVDGGMNMQDMGFINGASGIVNRGCHNPPNCGTGELHGGSSRIDNFRKVLTAMGIV